MTEYKLVPDVFGYWYIHECTNKAVRSIGMLKDKTLAEWLVKQLNEGKHLNNE